MDSFELNKVAGAVLGTLLFAFGTGFLAELIYEPKPAGKAGYDLPGGSKEAGGGEAPAPKQEGVAALLASADPEKGKGASKACAGCHSLEKGGGNKIGPHLWDIVERKKGEISDFSYSAGLKEKGGTWTYDDLDQFLTKPSEYIKGTKMSYQGIASAPDRANVIAYLRTLSESPKPLPEAAKKEEGKKEESKKDEGKKDEGKKEGGEAAGGDGFAAKVASADAKKGEAEVKVCQSCHSFEKGGPNKVGPDLYAVVGRKKGGVEGFDYSAGLKEKGGEWGYDDLNQFLTKPSEYIKGTKMAFQGVASEEKRAQIVAYLRTLAETPKPLPGADKAAEKKDEGAKPAEGDKKAETPAEAKPEGEKKSEETKPAEAEKKAEQPAEAKPEGEKKPEDPKPAEGDKKAEQPTEAKPEGEKKPEEAKPAEGEKPAEATPESEKKPEEAKPEGEKAEESKPAEGAQKPEESKPAEKPAEDKPAEDKPAEEKPQP